MAAPKVSGFSRLLNRKVNSFRYRGRYFLLTLWKDPMTPRLSKLQKDFDVVGVEVAANIDALPVLDDAVGVELAEFAVGRMFIGRQQADVRRYVRWMKPSQRLAAGVQNHLGKD